MLKKTTDYTDAFHETPNYSQLPGLRDEEKQQQLEQVFFPLLEKLAKSFFCRVELSICEETNTGELLLTGEELYLSHSGRYDRKGFEEILANADEVFLSGRGDSFEIRMRFDLSMPKI